MRATVAVPRPPAAFVGVALVLALIGFVAIASDGEPVWRLLRPGPANRLLIVVAVATTCCFVGILAGFAVTIAHRVARSAGRRVQPLSTTLLRAAPLTAAILAVVSLLTIASMDPGVPVDSDDPTARLEYTGRRGGIWGFITDWRITNVRPGNGERDDEARGDIVPISESPPYLWLVIAVVALAVAIAASWRWFALRSADERRADSGPADPSRDTLRTALAGVIDAMLADPDPNTAIRGAYARLLEGLDARGTGRRTYEAPIEHLDRVLSSVRVSPAPLRRLIELFEIARFSTHRLTATHRDQALAALRDVAAELGGGSALETDGIGSRRAGAAS